MVFQSFPYDRIMNTSQFDWKIHFQKINFQNTLQVTSNWMHLGQDNEQKSIWLKGDKMINISRWQSCHMRWWPWPCVYCLWSGYNSLNVSSSLILYLIRETSPRTESFHFLKVLFVVKYKMFSQVTQIGIRLKHNLWGGGRIILKPIATSSLKELSAG